MYENIESYKKFTNRLINIYSKYKDLPDSGENFFSLLSNLQCLLSIFFRIEFDPTDCCHTAESVWSLFDPKLNLDHNNIFHYQVNTHVLFHEFIALKYNYTWYIIQSYANVCEMNVKKVEYLPELLRTLQKTSNRQVYNELFGTSIKSDKLTSNVELEVKRAGFYSDLPYDKLLNLIYDFIKPVYFNLKINL